MPPPLTDGRVDYTDGSPATVDQYAKDVAAFMMWAAEPHLEARKRIGFQVMIFLVDLRRADVLHQEEGVGRRARALRRDREASRDEAAPHWGPSFVFAMRYRARSEQSMTKAVLGIIGGSGVYDLPGLENVREERIASPWGEPSAPLRIGEMSGLPVVFLPRHDKGHRLSPSDINYRANIDVLKRAGVTDLVSLSACGSFKEELPPGTFVLIDQFVDRTHKRESSFFGKGCVAHVSMAHPVIAAPAHPSRQRRDGRGHRGQARRHLCVHGRPAVLHATPRA